MNSALINPQVTGIYKLEIPSDVVFMVNLQYVAVVGGAPVGGSGVVDIIYERA